MNSGFQPARWFVVAALLAVGGCATQTHQQITHLTRPAGDLRIVLMPIDVELSELSAGGVAEPNATWTEAARGHILAALNDEAGKLRVGLVSYNAEAGQAEERERNLQLVRLHRAVGTSILIHQYQPGFELPAKGGRFDWSLGPQVDSIRRSHEADYALFLYVRDSYSSAGRVALIFAAALFGVSVPGGVQVGFGSLVDLKTGEIVWFNRLARSTGDLRTAAAAIETIQTIMASFPQ